MAVTALASRSADEQPSDNQSQARAGLTPRVRRKTLDARRMKLPNAQYAIVDERKLREYLLSTSHPIGRFKAAFLSSIGFTVENGELLRERLLELVKSEEPSAVESTPFGRKYLIRGTLTGVGGRTAEVVSVWFVPTEDDKPRLVTVYPR